MSLNENQQEEDRENPAALEDFCLYKALEKKYNTMALDTVYDLYLSSDLSDPDHTLWILIQKWAWSESHTLYPGKTKR